METAVVGAREMETRVVGAHEIERNSNEMATRASTRDTGETCQVLLQKVRRGQQDLRRSLNALQSSKKVCTSL